MELVDAMHHPELDQIRRNYFDYLEKAAGVLEGAILCLRDDSAPGTILHDAKGTAHNIKGNAFMYGFPELGRKAEKVESILLANLPANDLETNKLTEQDTGPTLVALLNLLEHIEQVCQGVVVSQAAEPLPTVVVPVETQAIPTSSRLPKWDRKSIVLAYEDSWLSSLMASLLEPEYHVVQCFTEEDIFTALVDVSPELLILDDDLLEGGSFAFLDRSNLNDIRVFLAFNENELEKVAEAISLGVSGFSANKLDILGLAQSVREFLEKPAQRVLIVDDDLAVREILKYHLESAGLQVDVAADGVEALDYLETVTPDLIILDRFMPRLEGGTVLYEIQNKVNLKSIPVLILTAMVNRGEAKNWFARGAADFIPKPFDPEEVSMRVKQHLESRRRQS